MDLALTLKANDVLTTQLEEVKSAHAKCSKKENDWIIMGVALVKKKKRIC